MRTIVVVAILVCCMPACFGQANEPCSVGTRPDCSEAVEFLQKLQGAVRLNDPTQVARLVRIPLRASLRGKPVLIRSRKRFIALYKEIFTPYVRCTVQKATPADVWGNYKGFMIGRGSVWWDKGVTTREAKAYAARHEEIDWTKYPFRVITVNNDSELEENCRSGKR